MLEAGAVRYLNKAAPACMILQGIRDFAICQCCVCAMDVGVICTYIARRSLASIEVPN